MRNSGAGVLIDLLGLIGLIGSVNGNKTAQAGAGKIWHGGVLDCKDDCKGAEADLGADLGCV